MNKQGVTDEQLKKSNDSILKTVDEVCFWQEVFNGIKKELSK